MIRQLDDLLASYGGLGAYNRNDQVSHHFLANEIAELQVTGTFIQAIFFLRPLWASFSSSFGSQLDGAVIKQNWTI